MRASRYVSYLAAEIEPQAISTLNRFEHEATKVLERISAAGSRGSAGFGLGAIGGNVRGLESTRRAATSASGSIEKVGFEARKAGAAANVMAGGFTHAAAALGIVQGPLGPLAGRLSALGSVLRTVTGFSLAGVLAGGGAFALGNIATQYQQVTDRLTAFYGTQQEANAALNDVIGISQRTRQSLLPVAELYTSIGRAAGNAGISQARAARISETVAKAAQIGGGTQEGKAAALVQFGQALSGDFKSAGQEINSILEQTPALAQALFDGLGVKGVGAFKKLAKEGSLSTEIIVQALERASAGVDTQFSKLPKRVGQSLTELSNNVAIAVGKFDAGIGATSGLSAAISLLANNLDVAVIAAGTLAAAFSASTFAAAANGVTSYISGLRTAYVAQKELSALQAQGNLVLLGSAEANRQKADFLTKGAVAERSAAAAGVEGAKLAQTQIRNTIGLLEKQIAAQTRAKETARLVDAGSRAKGGGGREDLVIASSNALIASQRALALSEQQLIAIEAELTAANVRLAVATGALTVAEAELVIADNVAAASTGRLAAAKAVLRTGIAATSSAASSLVGFLGGAWGVAFTAAAGAALYLSSRVDYAKASIDSFNGGEAALATRLGITTQQIDQQTASVRALAVALLQTNLVKARTAALDTTGQLAGDLATASNKIRVFPGSNGQAARDRQALIALSRKAQSGNFNPLTDFKQLNDIIGRNPETQKTTLINKLFGGDPARLAEDTKGLAAALFQIVDAKKEIAKFGKGPDGKLPPLIGGGGGKPETAAQHKARLNREAAVEAATSPLKKARAELALAKATGPTNGEDDAAYKARIAGLTQSVEGLAAAQHKAKDGAKAAEAARKREAVAVETASDKLDKLRGIIDDYTDDSPIRRIEKIKDAATKAKAKINDLIGERVKGFDAAFTPEDAKKVTNQIDLAVAQRINQPFTDSIATEKQSLDNLQLQLSGQGDLADLVQRRYELEKQMGPLSEDQIHQLAQQAVQQNKLNALMEERNAIIETNANFLGEVRDAGQKGIRSILGGDLKGGLKTFAEDLRNAFLDAKAQEIARKLFGDPEKKYRDEMTKGLNTSADNLTDSATALKSAADAIDRASAALGGTATGGGAGGQNAIGTLLGQTSTALGDVGDLVGGLTDAITAPPTPGQSSYDDNPIVVTGQRNRPVTMPGGVDSVASGLFSKLFSGNKLFGKGGSLSGGNGLLLAAGAINSLFPPSQDNYKGKKINDAIGGLVQTAAQFAPPPVQIALAASNAISNLLGVKPIAGGLFGVLGNVIGSVLGFGKKIVPKGIASIKDLSGNFTTRGKGAERDQAVGDANSVTQGIQRILDALGGELGSFAVSIGNVDGSYRVNTSGSTDTKKGKPGVFDFGKDQEAAIRFAILDAIQDGAITGIREGSIRLLKAGKDLDAALNKALKFEDVFRRLKKIKDPVGGAIDDLNREFKGLIKIFREAGATAEEWAQLEELYGLERADAIKNATSSAVQVLDDFIKGITAGPDSPLSRRTVYDNARTNVDAFRADIAAGKAVDQDALVAALQNYQAASTGLFGSRSDFFTDFDDILALANAAKANVPLTTSGNLPASPFDGLDANGNAIVTSIGTTNEILTAILTAVTAPPSSTGTGTGSTISNLPSNGGVGSELTSVRSTGGGRGFIDP